MDVAGEEPLELAAYGHYLDMASTPELATLAKWTPEAGLPHPNLILTLTLILTLILTLTRTRYTSHRGNLSVPCRTIAAVRMPDRHGRLKVRPTRTL